MEDMQVPKFISDIVVLKDTYLSYTSIEQNSIMKGFAKQLTLETYACLIQGTEKFRLVSPVFKQHLYSGVR